MNAYNDDDGHSDGDDIEHDDDNNNKLAMGDRFELQDEIQAVQDLDTYIISNEHDVHSTDPAALLASAVEAVAESPDAITDPQVFDIYRSILKHPDAVPGSVMSKLLDSISDALAAEVEATVRDVEEGDQQTFMAHKTPLEMYAFLLLWFVSAAEKVKAPGADEDEQPIVNPRARKGRGGKSAGGANARNAKKKESWTWIDQIPATLALISKILRLKTHRIWTTTPERDAFIKCVFTTILLFIYTHQILS